MTDPKPHVSRAPLAYENEAFLKSSDSRALRILSEYLEPLSHFRKQRVQDTVVFFGSARVREDGPLGNYYRDAQTLARLVTEWATQFTGDTYRFIVTSGGGPGIMEAANRGAMDANGKTIGLNIGLPFEQFPNQFITPDLNFEFHYFFMRKFWFAYLAKAMVVFPGFGTLDELFELLTLVQTKKLAKKISILLYGKSYWSEIVNFDALVRYGMISPDDLKLFTFADTPEDAMQFLSAALLPHVKLLGQETPAIAHTVKPE